MSNGSVFSQEKIFQHGDRISQYLNSGNTDAPVTMEIDLTNRCNNACPGCVGFKEDGFVMETSEALRLISEMAELGVRGLIFTGGGEPMLHRDVAEIVRHAHDSGIKVGFITSGQRPKHITDDDLLTILSCSTWLRVSQDAGSKERYKQIHGLPEKNFEEMLEFMRTLVKIKQEHNLKVTLGSGYLTGVWGYDEEFADLNAAAVYAIDAGMDYFQLRPFHYSERVIDFSEDIRLKAEEANTKLLSSAHKYKYMADNSKRNYTHCHGAKFASVITADSTLTLCCHFRNQDKGRMVDLKKVSLKDAWCSKQMDEKICAIDVSKCLPFCRADSINRSLEEIVQGKENDHKDFL